MTVGTRPLFAAVFLLLMAGCGGGGAPVRVNYDPAGAGLAAAYRTWGWLPHPGGRDTRPEAAEWSERIGAAVERALLAKSYTRQDSMPDFEVGWHLVTGEAKEATQISLYYGYTWGRWFPGGGVAYPGGYRAEFAPGTVIVEVVDRATGELVWRGISRIDLLARDTRQQDRDLAGIVARMFERFPPKT